MKEMSLIAAIKDYFGFKHGQTMSEFMAEFKELTPTDREYFKAGLQTVGYKITTS
jgi:hypothetical protein